MHNLIILFQNLIPQLHHRLRRRLGRGNVASVLQPLIEFLLCQINIFKVFFSVNHKRHGEDKDPQLPCLCLGDSAVAVRDNCYFHRLFYTPFYNPLEFAIL